MQYRIITYGCQMNKSDAERTAAVLEKMNHQRADSEESADLIIVVACSVRQSAVDRIYGKIKTWQKISARGGSAFGEKEKRLPITVLTGCILKQDKIKLSASFDFILPITEIHKLAQKISRLPADQVQNYFDLHPKYQSNFQAYVPISTGCNNFCAYCVVPYVRGAEICRPADEIVQEVKNLVNSGYKEITLLGQNVNSYSSQEMNFPQLLKTINNLPGNFWLRFMTSHPKDLSDELIEVMATGDKICEYLHLPIQSGNDEILKKMNRGYTAEYYTNLITKIRNKFAGIRKAISVSTDVIVGFPGETEKQFEDTALLMERVGFDMAYLAEYSPRAGTAAAKLKDEVSLKEKERRRKILTEILEKSALKQNRRLVGQTIEVLIDSTEKEYFYSKTRTFKTVKMSASIISKNSSIGGSGLGGKKSPALKIGEFSKVKINAATPFGLNASLSADDE